MPRSRARRLARTHVVDGRIVSSFGTAKPLPGDALPWRTGETSWSNPTRRDCDGGPSGRTSTFQGMTIASLRTACVDPGDAGLLLNSPVAAPGRYPRSAFALTSLLAPSRRQQILSPSPP